MRLEFKTDQRKISESLSEIFLITVTLFFGILFINLVFNIRSISRYYQTNFLCNLILVDKSTNNFQKLAKITKQSNKQKVWDFCKVFSR
tara:strand:+ start:210 stop:476 length:267 start_codon:yes stop_codon:yes gene_type:complete